MCLGVLLNPDSLVDHFVGPSIAQLAPSSVILLSRDGVDKFDIVLPEALIFQEEPQQGCRLHL